ncbi:hypothetical protein GCM10009839_07340 [Catenulispora yoronensis]|uniref:Uncharacterized protein n=1 Tax=Catenulispora yoronensis TaxID=450799 RepID=A0ABP5F4X4_9ACTN
MLPQAADHPEGQQQVQAADRTDHHDGDTEQAHISSQILRIRPISVPGATGKTMAVDIRQPFVGYGIRSLLFV